MDEDDVEYTVDKDGHREYRIDLSTVVTTTVALSPTSPPVPATPKRSEWTKEARKLAWHPPTGSRMAPSWRR